MSEKQTEAEFLANELDIGKFTPNIMQNEVALRERAANELRRLHEVNVELLASLIDTLYFLERHSNRWDGVNGKHPFTVCESARAAIAKATKGQE